MTDEYDPSEPYYSATTPTKGKPPSPTRMEPETFAFVGDPYCPSNNADVKKPWMDRLERACLNCGFKVQFAAPIPAFLLRRKEETMALYDSNRPPNDRLHWWDVMYCRKCKSQFRVRIYVPPNGYKYCTYTRFPPNQKDDVLKYSNSMDALCMLDEDKASINGGMDPTRRNHRRGDRRGDERGRSRSRSPPRRRSRSRSRGRDYHRRSRSRSRSRDRNGNTAARPQRISKYPPKDPYYTTTTTQGYADYYSAPQHPNVYPSGYYGYNQQQAQYPPQQYPQDGYIPAPTQNSVAK
jgi:hypothetical protein